MTLTTVSGDPITIGIGTGTSIKDLKRGQPTAENKARIVDILRYALLIGYNHIDTAEVYTTQPEVGTAIAGFQRKVMDHHQILRHLVDDQEKALPPPTLSSKP